VTTIDLGLLSDFASGEARQIKGAGRTLVVVRIEDDLYVLDDRCSHEDFSLSLGSVDVAQREIECERHGAMFDLTTGQPASFPATRPVARYDVVCVDGRYEVVVS
jgi:3-phenylpropionate/trans-cinnamate dioxygenase ferredoxin subunit